jgi:hypothetical protein
MTNTPECAWFGMHCPNPYQVYKVGAAPTSSKFSTQQVPDIDTAATNAILDTLDTAASTKRAACCFELQGASHMTYPAQLELQVTTFQICHVHISRIATQKPPKLVCIENIRSGYETCMQSYSTTRCQQIHPSGRCHYNLSSSTPKQTTANPLPTHHWH